MFSVNFEFNVFVFMILYFFSRFHEKNIAALIFLYKNMYTKQF